MRLIRLSILLGWCKAAIPNAMNGYRRAGTPREISHNYNRVALERAVFSDRRVSDWCHEMVQAAGTPPGARIYPQEEPTTLGADDGDGTVGLADVAGSGAA
jgi:hypothetical protein